MHVYEWLLSAAEALCVLWLLLTPALFWRKGRRYLGNALHGIGFLWGLVLWVFCFVLVARAWGLTIVLICSFLGILPVIPLGFVCFLFKGNWGELLNWGILFVAALGSRFLGAFIAVSGEAR